MYLFSKYFYICVYIYVHICVCMCIYVYICVYLNISSLRYQDFDLKKRQARHMGMISICTMQPIFHKSTPTLWLSPDHPIPCHHPWSFGPLLPEGRSLCFSSSSSFAFSSSRANNSASASWNWECHGTPPAGIRDDAKI